TGAAAATRHPSDGRRQQGERRCDCLGNDVEERVPDNGSYAELRVRERARDGNIEVDLPARVLQHADREADGQVFRARVFPQIAEGKLVDEKVIVRGQGPLVEQVVNIHVERALRDRIARVLGGISREPGKLDSLRLGFEVHIRKRGERIDRTTDIERRAAVNL